MHVTVSEGRERRTFVLVLVPLNFSGPEGGVFGESLQSTTALLVDIWSGWEGKRAAPFVFAVPPLNFHRAAARGGAGFGGSLPLADTC